MEASLLPSERTRSLAEKVVLVGVRNADPACEPLRKEFDARASAWVVVLDPRGELLDSGLADEKSLLKKKETLALFPGQFFDRIEKSLQRKESLQDLERRWAKDPKEESGFETLASRLEEMMSYGRLRELCRKLAAVPGVPDDRRAAARFRGVLAGPKEFASAGVAEFQARFSREGEQLIADHPDHPKASEALQALFQAGYSWGFDVPGKSAAGIARLNALAQGLKDPAPLRARIGELAAIRHKEIAKLEAARAAAKGNESREAWYAGSLGDAEATVRVFSKPPHETMPYYQGWVREAREKLQRLNEKPASVEK